MQNLTLLMIALLAGSAAVAVAVHSLDRRGRWLPIQVGLGLLLGLVGAFIALVGRTDVVPDGPEDGLQRLFVVAVTALAVIGTWYRIARA